MKDNSWSGYDDHMKKCTKCTETEQHKKEVKRRWECNINLTLYAHSIFLWFVLFLWFVAAARISFLFWDANGAVLSLIRYKCENIHEYLLCNSVLFGSACSPFWMFHLSFFVLHFIFWLRSLFVYLSVWFYDFGHDLFRVVFGVFVAWWLVECVVHWP